MKASGDKGKKEVEEGLRRNEQKWGRPTLEAGFTLLPSVLVKRQKALGLDAIDMNIVVHLAERWWYAESPPQPTRRDIAESMGISASTVQRRIALMEAAGYIKRIERSKPGYGRIANEYDLAGLVAKLAPLAAEELELRKQRAALRSKKNSRKAPAPVNAALDDSEGEA